MRAVRRHLRVYVAAWLMFQAVALSTVVPRNCCAAHLPASAKTAPDCHEAAPAAQDAHAHHRGAAGHHAVAPDTTTPDHDTCSIRGACGGPMAAFLAQLSLHGVLGDRPQLAPDVVSTHLESVAREHLIGRLIAPDSPPPRA
jgi:hypothetical protein